MSPRLSSSLPARVKGRISYVKRLAAFACLALSLLLMLTPLSVFAQESTGSLFGTVTDSVSGKAIGGIVVVATAPTLPGEQTAITDNSGRYQISKIPPGTYTLAFTDPIGKYAPYTATDVTLQVGRDVKVAVTMLPSTIRGKVIVVKKPVVSSIDMGNTTTGATVTSEFMSRVATARSATEIVEVTPGATKDPYGVSFNGTSSPENGIFIDGVNTTDTGLGVKTTDLPLEFLDQIEVKTGGYMPEYGNTTGGVVSAITKVGGNDFHGTLFSFTTPFSLMQNANGQYGEAISHRIHLDFREQTGFELGGPIIKDYLWFHVGFAPTYEQYTLTRSFSAKDASGVFQTIGGANQTFRTISQSYVFTSKLTFNPSQNHRLTLAFSGNPTVISGVQASYFGPITNGIQSAALMNGDPTAYDNRVSTGGYDGVLNYDGKFLDKHLLVSAILGYHHVDNTVTPNTAIGRNFAQIQWTGEESLAKFMPGLASACTNNSPGAADSNRCPVTNYFQGGAGLYDHQIQDRYSLKASLTALLGSHKLKIGGEVMRASLTHTTRFSGDSIEQVVRGDTQFFDSARYGQPTPAALAAAGGGYSSDPRVLDPSNYAFVSQYTNTTYYWNLAGYIQDTWSILDGSKIGSLTVQGGLRFDHQIPYGGDGTVPFHLRNMSPRLGVIYDPSGTGRSKIFASYGRFYELMPLSILDRAFPHQSQILTYRQRGTCSDTDPLSCQPLSRSYVRATPESILQPLEGQAVDTYEAGIEYQIFNDLLVGARYTASRMVNLIEDYSTNNGNTFGVGDIGGKPYTSTLVQPNSVTGLYYAYLFNNPARNYDAFTLYLNKTLANHFLGNFSYTLSFLRGVEQGLFRSEDGELHPNNNNTFNSAALFPNVYGYLGADHRHQFKLDGAYLFDVTKNFLLIPNIRFRLTSGSPYSIAGADPNFGPAQAYILSRGTGGETPWYVQVDLGLKAEQRMPDGSRLNYGLTLLNVFNGQTAIHSDERYGLNDQYIRPIAGGTSTDSAYAKTTNQTPPKLNPSYGAATAYQLPFEARFDVKYTF